jgi:hypothetical protein
LSSIEPESRGEYKSEASRRGPAMVAKSELSLRSEH